MNDPLHLARSARENLAHGLAALQSPGVPHEVMEVAEPIAQAMSSLHGIETSRGSALAQNAPTALAAVRRALGMLQSQPSHQSLPAVNQAMEAIASSLSLIHTLSQSAAQPQAVHPPGAHAGPAAFAGTVAMEQFPAVHGGPPPGPATQPSPAVPQQFPQGQAPQNPYAQPQAPQIPYAQPQAPQNPYAQPQAPQNPYAQPQAAQAPAYPPAQPPAPAASPQYPPPPQFPESAQAFPLSSPRGGAQAPAPYPAANAPPSQAQPAHPVPAWANPPPPPQQPAPAPAAGSWQQPKVPSGIQGAPKPGAVRVEAELGAHSPTNFYKGLSGNDVIDSGGIFIATYQIPEIGQDVVIKVSMPGGYEFEAAGIVRWTRDMPHSGADSPPGFGAQFTHISPEGRQLVYRYVRNREPLFHDDL